MFCASLLAGRPFWQMPYGAQPHRDEGCFASAIEMRWTGIMSVSSLKNHWSSYCSLLLFRFELRSLPWIRLADITRFRTRNLNWIERSRLFCYSVINLLCRTLFDFSFFAFELQKLLYFITSTFVCQELFFFLFTQKLSNEKFFVVIKQQLLSLKQLWYFIMLTFICQELFSFILISCSKETVLCCSSYILSCSVLCVKQKIQKIRIFYFVSTIPHFFVCSWR